MPNSGFRRDLYQGTAAYYDEFRLPYPQLLVDELVERAHADGRGRLMDLACGTGQLSFAMHEHFAQTWAVDQEPDMVEFARAKATAAGIADMKFVTAAAEELTAPECAFDVIVVGNAFHRLQRDVVAARMRSWLRDGGWVALIWSDGSAAGEATGSQAWQVTLAELVQRWRARLDAAESDQSGPRVPTWYSQDRSDRPDIEVMRDVGLDFVESRQFVIQHDWTADALVGNMFSTSVLSRAALGALAGEFEAEVRQELAAESEAGVFRQDVSFAYELFRPR
jgi:SAM-dependent methyltransferase